MSVRPVIIKPKWPALSSAGRWLVIAAAPWFLLTLLVAETLGLVGPHAPQFQRWLFVLVAIAPGALGILHAWLGQVPGLRWLHHRTQARLAVGANGLELQGPHIAPHLYAWAEMGGLRTRPLGGADLLSTDGVVLARMPESLMFGGGTWWRSESIASVVVGARPDRYRLSRANWAGVPTEFALRTSDDPVAGTDPWAARRRWINVAIYGTFAAVTAFLLYRYLTA